MNKREETRGIGKKKNMALEIMFFRKWAKLGFLQSQARSHTKDLVGRLRNTACGELSTEAHGESGHSVTEPRSSSGTVKSEGMTWKLSQGRACECLETPKGWGSWHCFQRILFFSSLRSFSW